MFEGSPDVALAVFQVLGFLESCLRNHGTEPLMWAYSVMSGVRFFVARCGFDSWCLQPVSSENLVGAFLGSIWVPFLRKRRKCDFRNYMLLNELGYFRN